MRATLACCARAARGQPAAPPRREMNVRRCMPLAENETEPKLSTSATRVWAGNPSDCTIPSRIDPAVVSAIATRAGVSYAAIIFSIGFIFGTIRVLLVAPGLGETAAVSLEAP